MQQEQENPDRSFSLWIVFSAVSTSCKSCQFVQRRQCHKQIHTFSFIGLCIDKYLLIHLYAT